MKNIVLRRFIVWSDGYVAQVRSILSSQFYRAIALASFLSGTRTRLITETDAIGGTVKNVAFRKIKTGECTPNTSAEFCRAANKHVPSVKPLFRRTITIKIRNCSKLTDIKIKSFFGGSNFYLNICCCANLPKGSLPTHVLGRMSLSSC